jgi:hypothetical protein
MPRAIGFLLCVFVLTGCASTRQSVLQLTGNPRGPATYEFKETVYRETPRGREILAYGLLPFDNSPISINFDSKWPERGFVTFYLRAAPLADGRYAVALLGPCKCAGPGDDEILAGVAEPGQLTLMREGPVVRLELRDVAMKSRNKPAVAFHLSGAIHATPADEKQFAKELKEFEWEYNSRTPPPPPFPPV